MIKVVIVQQAEIFNYHFFIAIFIIDYLLITKHSPALFLKSVKFNFENFIDFIHF